MQISTSQFYDRASARLSGLASRADALQTQISSGKKLPAPSSDSAAYQRLRGLKTAAADDKAYAGNLTLAGGILQEADTTLSAITTQLQRAAELAVRARTGTQTDQTRIAIAVEIDEIIGAMAGLANTTDTRGQPLFGGIDGSAAAMRQPDGSYLLAETTAAPIPIGSGQSIQPGETAARVFKVGDGDAFQVLADLSAALKSGGDVWNAVGTAIADLSTASTQVVTVQASLGARAARVEVEQNRLADVGLDREEARSAIEDTDITQTVIELQKTMTILSATQASFTKLQSLSLFDYLR